MQKKPDRAAGNNSHKTIDDEFLHIFVRFPLIPFSNKITAQKPKSNFTFSILFDYFIRQASNYFQIRQFSMEFNFLYIFSHWLLRFFTHVSFFFCLFVCYFQVVVHSLASSTDPRSIAYSNWWWSCSGGWGGGFILLQFQQLLSHIPFCCCCLCWTHMFAYNSNDIEREKESSILGEVWS